MSRKERKKRKKRLQDSVISPSVADLKSEITYDR